MAGAGYVLDPHTAVGYRVMQRRRPERVQVLLSTASPYKFCADVLRAWASGLGAISSSRPRRCTD